MGYGGSGFGALMGGIAQGYEQGRRQVWAEKINQANILQQQSNDAFRTWQAASAQDPDSATSRLSWQAHIEAQDQISKLLTDKGPGAWNQMKGFFGMIPLLGKHIAGPTGPQRNAAVGGGGVPLASVTGPPSAPSPVPTQTQAQPESLPGSVSAASAYGLPGVSVPPAPGLNEMIAAETGQVGAPQPGNWAEPTAGGVARNLQLLPQQAQVAAPALAPMVPTPGQDLSNQILAESGAAGAPQYESTGPTPGMAWRQTPRVPTEALLRGGERPVGAEGPVASSQMPAYGQTPMTTYQKMWLNPPGSPDLRPLIAEFKNLGPNGWYGADPATKQHIVEQYIQTVARYPHVAPHFMEALKMFDPSIAGNMIGVSGDTQAGRLLGVPPGQSRPFPFAVYDTAIRAAQTQPQNDLKNREANTISQLIAYRKAGIPEDDPRIQSAAQELAQVRTLLDHGLSEEEEISASVNYDPARTVQRREEILAARTDNRNKEALALLGPGITSRLDYETKIADMNYRHQLGLISARDRAKAERMQGLYDRVHGGLDPNRVESLMRSDQSEAIDAIREALRTRLLEKRRLYGPGSGPLYGQVMTDPVTKAPMTSPVWAAIDTLLRRYGYPSLDEFAKEVMPPAGQTGTAGRTATPNPDLPNWENVFPPGQ